MARVVPEMLSHTMVRLDVRTGIPFEEFRARFEDAAPPFDEVATTELARSGANWDDMKAAVRNMAPHDLIRYATIDATAVMSIAGNTTKAVEYLLGNHVVAESMFRHDPHALLYAPLRVLLFSNGDNEAIFSLDQPSTAFGSLGVDSVSRVGFDLDQKVTALLEFIGVDVTFPPQAEQ